MSENASINSVNLQHVNNTQLPQGTVTPDKNLTIDFTNEKNGPAFIAGAELEYTGAAKTPVDFEDYEVKKGDSVWKVAKEAIMKENGCVKPSDTEIIQRMHEIMKDNNLHFEKDGVLVIIHPGDKLKLRVPGQEADPAVEEPPAAEEPPVNQTPPKKEKMSAAGRITYEEANNARILGDNVSDYLVGYTSDAEQGHVRRIIQEDVTVENVADFLAGYERHRGLGNHFFKQLGSEYGFKDKQNLMRNVAEKLGEHLQFNGQIGWAREVGVILENQQFNSEHISILDTIVGEYLVTIPELKC